MGSSIIYNYFPDLETIQKEQIEALMPLYKEWNSKINVISRTDIDNLYIHHVLHSLAIAKFFYAQGFLTTKIKDNSLHPTILDVGTGGGFPGIPLAILYPNVDFLLVDSIGKKITVAQSVAEQLGLKNIKTVKSRVEELPKEYPSQFDWIVSRAVTELKNFIPWIKGRYTQGAVFLKGGELVQEVAMAVRMFRLDSRKIDIFSVSSWFKEEYFAQKQLLSIRK